MVWKTGLFALILAALLAPAGFGALPLAAAQSAEENWTQPANLSHSGSATAPQILLGEDGQFHALWVDLFAGPIYTVGDGSQWSQPTPVAFPFGNFVPELIADGNGSVHAIWIDDNNYLYYSRVAAANIGNFRSWFRPLRVASDVTAMDVALDGQGLLHLSFVQAADLRDRPAGVYYIQAKPPHFYWTPQPVLLSQSPYFRSATQENSHIKIALPANPEDASVYVAWDNRALERVFTTRSLDRGATWSQPLEVDAPPEGSLVGGPSGIIVSTRDANVLLIWQNNNTGTSCTQYYQWSFDGGATWQPRQRMLENIPGCPGENQVLIDPDGYTYLMTSIHRQVYLLAWDGQQWSSPQLQSQLTSFVDAVTSRPVAFSCRQALLAPNDQLYIIGCDESGGSRTAEGAAQSGAAQGAAAQGAAAQGAADIWLTSRQLGSTADWFTQDTQWSDLSAITGGQLEVLSPRLIAGADGRIHAFWSQATLRAGSNVPARAAGEAIYYTRLEGVGSTQGEISTPGGQWLSPEPVLRSPEGIAEQPTVAVGPAVDANGQVYAAWVGGQSGQIYFSTVESSRAGIASAWSEPVAVPLPQPAGSAPDLLVGGNGGGGDTAGVRTALFLAYALPFNEQRGIYLARSSDGGQTWGEPQRVFDAEAAGWAMVDRPKLGLAANGHLHLVWTRYSAPSGTGPLGLYYSRSEDGGATWGQAETVVEKPVVWSWIGGSVRGAVHRVWQEMDEGRTTIWHEESLDGGQTWKRIAPVSIFGDAVGEPALTLDGAGRLHLLQVVSRGATAFGAQNFALQHWMYDGTTWQAEQNKELGEAGSSGLQNLTAVVSQEGELAVIFTATSGDATLGTFRNNLFVTSRELEVPPVEPRSENGVETAPGFDGAQPATGTQPAVPTPVEPRSENGVETAPGFDGAQPASQDQSSPGGLFATPDRPENLWLGSIIGPLAAGLIVLIVFFLGVRGTGPRRRR